MKRLKDEIIDTLTPKLAEIGQPEVALLMPVHNEAENIENGVMEFYNVIGRKLSLEIVCCEDGSTDGTQEILKNLSEKRPMKVILGAERKGYSNAIKDGLKIVSSKYVLFVDSDGQHLPSDFWKLYEYKNDYEIVSGRRSKRADVFHRKVMSSAFQFMARKIFKLPVLRDITAPYRLVHTDVARTIAEECKYMTESFWTEFTIRACKKGFKMIEVTITHKNRAWGSTRVYKPSRIPRVVFSQLLGMLRLWREL